MNVVTRLASELRLMMRRPERLQFAALCYRKTGDKTGIEVLLITSRGTGRWVIPKGWPMNGKLAHAVAEREAYEEAGVKGKAEVKPLGTYSYMKGLDSGFEIPCKVQVHALKVSGFANNYKEKGQREMAWFSCAEAAARVVEPGLKELILGFENRGTQDSAESA
ncbi:NUDIX hydrolase [Rhizobium sp. C4]|uniref:NUDIX hydrolase n=1 Tax=Rhizobium sp. C4 TaxID=1349800 RepID=UPI001E379442|nr:NUDIX hydrolase [Rhizobium sp. C4]MCD2172834.1 NUDIX hydrolase [Rhizobium sp. C4]